jgi:hypothetical protein
LRASDVSHCRKEAAAAAEEEEEEEEAVEMESSTLVPMIMS